MTSLRRCSVLLAMMGAAGCGGSMAGSWDGSVTCGGIPFEFGFLLTDTTNKIAQGEGQKFRSFTNVNGNVTEEYVDFDITIERLKLSGEQELISDLECTGEDKAVDGVFVLDVLCEPQQFNDWMLSWDGDETIQLTSSECSGAVLKGQAGEE